MHWLLILLSGSIYYQTLFHLNWENIQILGVFLAYTKLKKAMKYTHNSPYDAIGEEHNQYIITLSIKSASTTNIKKR
jgi:hypothetical protein